MGRFLYLAAFAYMGVCLYALEMRPASAIAIPHRPVDPGSALTAGPEWFAQVRGRCNPVEVDVAMRATPPPAGFDGTAFQGACYALAGRIGEARQVIGSLPEAQRGQAAGILLSIADPVADAGDDRAAGPMMRLVLEFVPENYIALFHAGMSEYALGETDAARLHLEHFLRVYTERDGFFARATEVLARLKAGEGG